MRISNKEKQAVSDNKALSGRLLRREPIADSHIRNAPKRHDPNACPICGARIQKTASGGRRKHSCEECGASINKAEVCASCGTRRIWQGTKGTACRGCGATYK